MADLIKAFVITMSTKKQAEELSNLIMGMLIDHLGSEKAHGLSVQVVENRKVKINHPDDVTLMEICDQVAIWYAAGQDMQNKPAPLEC